MKVIDAAARGLAANNRALLTPRRTTRAAIKALDATVYDVAILNESGRQGTFYWDGSVAPAVYNNDPNEGIYLPPVPGSNGAWVRGAGQRLDPRHFGAALDSSYTATGTDDTAALQAYANYLAYLATSLQTVQVEFWIPPGKIAKVTDTLTIERGIAVNIEGGIVVSAAANVAKTWLKVGSLTPSTNALNSVAHWINSLTRATQSDWSSQADTGVRMIATSAEIRYGKIWGFAVNVSQTSPYSKTWLGDLRNGQIGLHVNAFTDGSGSLFTNQAQFFGGEFVVGSVNNGLPRYGIKVSTTYTGINTLTFRDQSFELNKTGAGAADCMAYLLSDVNGSSFLNQRMEVSGGLVATLSGACSNLTFRVNCVDSVVSLIDNSTSKLANVLAVAALDYSLQTLVYDSGNLIDELTPYDATYWTHPRMEGCWNAGAYPIPCTFDVRFNLDAVDYSTGLVDLPGAGAFPGIRIDTSRCKNFVIQVDGATGGNVGLFMTAIGSDGVHLTAAGTIEPSASISANSGVYGGRFLITSLQLGREQIIRVADAVTTLFVGPYGPQIKRWRVYSADGLAATMSESYAYDGKRVANITPARGAYKKGAQIFKASPASAASAGWVCSASGNFAGALAVTATTTASLADVTMSALTGLYRGLKITIAGVTGTKTIIGFKIGNIAIVDSNCDASVSAAVVTTVSPTFLTMPNLT